MSNWAATFLGIIAVATLTMAVVQVGVIVAAGRLARRVERLADQVEHELKPLFSHMNAMGAEASRAMGLAAAQVDRIDRLFADLVVRIDQTIATIQGAVTVPAREGRAMMSALRAALEALRDFRGGRRGQRRTEDEDALFI